MYMFIYIERGHAQEGRDSSEYTKDTLRLVDIYMSCISRRDESMSYECCATRIIYTYTRLDSDEYTNDTLNERLGLCM